MQMRRLIDGQRYKQELVGDSSEKDLKAIKAIVLSKASAFY